MGAFSFLPSNLFISVPNRRRVPWPLLGAQIFRRGGGVTSYSGAEGPLVSPRSSCFGLTPLARCFSVSRPSCGRWKEMRSP